MFYYFILRPYGQVQRIKFTFPEIQVYFSIFLAYGPGFWSKQGVTILKKGMELGGVKYALGWPELRGGSQKVEGTKMISEPSRAEPSRARTGSARPAEPAENVPFPVSRLILL